MEGEKCVNETGKTLKHLAVKFPYKVPTQERKAQQEAQ